MAYNGTPSYRMPKMPGTVIAALVIVWASTGLGAIGLCFGLSLLNWSGGADGHGSTVTLLVVLLVGALILNVVVALAIHNRRNWARITMIVFCVIGAAASLINLFTGTPAAIVGFGLNLALIVLLANDASKAWCAD